MTDNTVLFLGGMFNQSFLGIQYYLWLMFLLLFVGLCISAIFYFFFWMKLKPYHGVFWSHLRKTGASSVFDEHMHFDLITERSAKVIFNEPFKAAQEAENDTTVAQTATIGSVSMDFIFDPDKATYPDSTTHVKIEDVSEQWNTNNPTDQVRTLIKFYRYLLEGKFDDGYDTTGIKRFFLVPWSRVRMMYKERQESGYFGFVMSLASLINASEEDKFNQYGIFLLMMFGGIDVMMFIAWIIMRKP